MAFFIESRLNLNRKNVNLMILIKYKESLTKQKQECYLVEINKE